MKRGALVTGPHYSAQAECDAILVLRRARAVAWPRSPTWEHFWNAAVAYEEEEGWLETSEHRASWAASIAAELAAREEP